MARFSLVPRSFALAAPLAFFLAGACGSVAAPGPAVDGDASVVGDATPPDAARSNDAQIDASPRLDASDASTDAGDAADAAACPVCRYPGAPTSAGTLASPGLVETSGLAASRVHPNVLYAHNDSGDSARIFVVGTNGAAQGVVSVTGAPAVDWEDIAVGKCPSGSCVFVGDIGDNDKVRDDISLVRFAEPALGATTAAADVFPLRYPDGRHNAETLVVDDAGAVYVITKETAGPVSVVAFGVPGAPGTALTGRIVATFVPPTFGIPAVTGGDFFGGPCPRMLVRTYAAILLFEGVFGDGPAELAKRPFRTLQAPTEQQGEAVAFSADGKSIFSASEGTRVALSTWRCGP